MKQKQDMNIDALCSIRHLFFPELGCWIGVWPVGCEGSECERGHQTVALQASTAIGTQAATSLILIVSNFLIYIKFRNQEDRMRRYSGSNDHRLSREIAKQGFLYSAAAFNTFLWGFLAIFFGTVDVLGDAGNFAFSLIVRQLIRSLLPFNRYI